MTSKLERRTRIGRFVAGAKVTPGSNVQLVGANWHAIGHVRTR